MRRAWKMRWLAALLAGIVVAIGVGLVVKRDEVVGRYWLWRADATPDADATELYRRALDRLGPRHERLVRAFAVHPADLDVSLDVSALRDLSRAEAWVSVTLTNLSSRRLRLANLRASGILEGESPPGMPMRLGLWQSPAHQVVRIEPGEKIVWWMRGSPLATHFASGREWTLGAMRAEITLEVGTAVYLDPEAILNEYRALRQAHAIAPPVVGEQARIFYEPEPIRRAFEIPAQR